MMNLHETIPRPDETTTSIDAHYGSCLGPRPQVASLRRARCMRRRFRTRYARFVSPCRKSRHQRGCNSLAEKCFPVGQPESALCFLWPTSFEPVERCNRLCAVTITLHGPCARREISRERVPRVLEAWVGKWRSEVKWKGNKANGGAHATLRFLCGLRLRPVKCYIRSS